MFVCVYTITSDFTDSFTEKLNGALFFASNDSLSLVTPWRDVFVDVFIGYVIEVIEMWNKLINNK